MMTKRRRFTPEFKAQVVLEVLTGARTAAEACREHTSAAVRPNVRRGGSACPGPASLLILGRRCRKLNRNEPWRPVGLDGEGLSWHSCVTTNLWAVED